tara:strand:- start:64 stop:888 length:825 start_codon:yes stop_codon:yes gene_type:complete
MNININGKLLDFSVPKVMGILNITPDSFYDGGKYNSESKIINQLEKMIFSGADIIDVGGYSSRPGAHKISIDEELNRVIPVIKLISKKFPKIIISIDTFRSLVAKKAIDCGAHIINDISGGNLDINMFKTVSKLNVPYILMHMRGNPSNMMSKTHYKSISKELIEYFKVRISMAKSEGINDIIIDPGFGFSKTIEQNYELMNNLHKLKIFKIPIMVGVSRKSMVYKTLNISPEMALNGSTILHTISILNGANILRVHDVLEAVECVKIMSNLNS